jgi:hypothetical protein
VTITDADRERVVRELTRHCGDGRLTLDELEERVGEAWAASTREELQLALRELPPFRSEREPEPEPRRHRETVGDELRSAARVAAAAATVPAAAARRARPATASSCGMARLGKPPTVLLVLAVLFVLTSHWILAAVMFFIAVPKLQRAYARA